MLVCQADELPDGVVVLAAYIGRNDVEPTLKVGNCVQPVFYESSKVKPVDCASDHTGRIIAAVDSKDLCPGNTDVTVNADDKYWCIVNDLPPP